MPCDVGTSGISGQPPGPAFSASAVPLGHTRTFDHTSVPRSVPEEKNNHPIFAVDHVRFFHFSNLTYIPCGVQLDFQLFEIF
jgi:hypothetical protein